MSHLTNILEPGYTYHVYNRANGRDKIFTSRDNYCFFLKRYRHFISIWTDTFCYCLMPNHFHLLLRIKEEKEIFAAASSVNLQGFSSQRGGTNLEGFAGQSEGANLQDLAARIVTNQFSKLFNSYAKAFNKQQNRKGSLFMKTFKKKPVTDDKYLRKLVHYIHYNPVEAGLCSKPEEWSYSSYAELISERPTMLAREELINWFNDKKNFIYCHSHPPEVRGIEV